MTVNDTSWRIGSVSSPVNRVYDALRRGLNRDLVRTLTDAMGAKQDWRVLEAGSGTAYASSLFRAQPSARLAAALDHDPAALGEGRARDPGLPGVGGDLLHLPFADGSFDLVWNSSTLEHLDQPLDALREMARVTRAGGCVFVGVPYASGPLGFQRWIADTPVGVWIGPVFSVRKLEALMQAAGLTVKSSRVYFLGLFIGVLAEKT